MTDLIKREDAIKVVESFLGTDLIADKIKFIPTAEPNESFEWCHDCKEYDQEKHCCHRWTKVIRKTIAEIEEEYKPKRGEWINRTHNTLIAQVNFAYCSECGQPIMHEHTRPLWNFCPNCGARMKGADDEDN